MTAAPNPLDMAGVVERLTEVATRDTAVAVIVRSSDLRALLSAFKARGEALEPFATFGAENVTEDGWASNIHRERISDWFGPSDFARTALTQTQGDDHE